MIRWSSIVLFISIAIRVSFAQGYEIIYRQKTIYPDNAFDLVFKQEASATGSFTVKTGEERESYNGSFLALEPQQSPFISYDARQRTLTYNQFIVNKPYLLRESIPLVDWQIDQTRDTTILGFHCQRATTDFRGRSYEAWFTNQLGIVGGIWKLVGLPGYVLAAKSLDGVVKFSALSVKPSSRNYGPLLPPFVATEDRFYSWEEYCTEYARAMRRIRRSLAADSDPDVEYQLTVNQMEIIEF